MSRNFGLGQRDMSKAGRVALERDSRAKGLSFSTAATVSARWSSFVKNIHESGVRKMEDITGEHVKQYGRDLADRVEDGLMAASTAQNYVSAINTVMGIATGGAWKSISPTKDCEIMRRSFIRADAPGALDRLAYGRALDAVREELGPKSAAVVELCRELGLRSKEASLFDARSAVEEATERGFVTITEGTKGGLEREVPITTQEQANALVRAAAAQGDGRAVMPADAYWRSWREGELRDARELVAEHTGGGLHDLRSAYACERYADLTGHAAPCAGGEIQDREVDAAAREQIAAELGHGRTDVAGAYVGGRR